MNPKLSIAIVLFVLCSAVQSSIAQLSEDAKISIITCRQGDEIYNTFGHTAIRVYDPGTRKDELFNFGVFNFNEPGFTPKFLRGKLLYYLGKNRYTKFLDNYTDEKRTVIEQHLNLNQLEKEAVYSALRENYKPENRRYLYDFFFDNCTTRTRDLLEKSIPNYMYIKTDREVTYRQLLDEYTKGKPWSDFGIDLIIGSKADKITTVRDQMFLPEYLYKNLEKATVNGQPLVESTELILDYEKENERRQDIPFLTPMILFGFLFLLEVINTWTEKNQTRPYSFVEKYDKLWFFILGICGLVLLFMWFGTDHVACSNNFNLLWMNPLFLFPSLRKKSNGIWILIFCVLLAIGANAIFQQMHFASLIIIGITLIKLMRASKLQRAATQLL